MAEDIRRDGHDVWLDEWSIRVGECIPTKIEEGIAAADFVLLLLSRHAVSSKWVEREWKTAFWEEVRRNSIMVLPVCLEPCTVPKLLETKKYARLFESYEGGICEIKDAIRHLSRLRAMHDFYHGVDAVRAELTNDTPEQALKRHEHWDRFALAVDSLQRWASIEIQRGNTLHYLKQYGLSVKQLQEQLHDLGVYHGALNDEFTEDVADAITTFQRDHNLRHIDGVFGPLTYIAMADAAKNRKTRKETNQDVNRIPHPRRIRKR